MKFLKIFLLLLVPAITTVSCRKACIQPSTNVTAETPALSEELNNNVSARSGEVTEEPPKGTTITEVVASGDGDRDGGDKRQKKR